MTVYWGLCIFYITLVPFLSSSQNTTQPTNSTTNNETTLCYACDSMLDKRCFNDSLIQDFSKKCEGNPGWCYVSKGVANILIFAEGHLERSDEHRVVRGCSRPRNRPDCVRVVQAKKLANFTVCNCNTTECNGNSSLEKNISIFIEDSSENLRTSRILAITWLCIMLIGPAFSNFGVTLFS